MIKDVVQHLTDRDTLMPPRVAAGGLRLSLGEVSCTRDSDSRVTAGLLTLMLGSFLVLRPTPATSTESCLASVAASSACAFQCIGDIQLLCGPANAACHEFNAQFFRVLASTPAHSEQLWRAVGTGTVGGPKRV